MPSSSASSSRVAEVSSMPYRLLLSATLCAAFASPARANPKPGEFPNESIQVDAITREYRLFVPKSVDFAKPAPLVVAFHGMLIDSKDLMPKYTKLNETAEKHGILMVYPNAIDRSWGLAPEKVKKDLAFFDALLVKLQKEYKIDAERIYVLGMSNGGYFAHLVGKERSKTVAAVASHSGPLSAATRIGYSPSVGPAKTATNTRTKGTR